MDETISSPPRRGPRGGLADLGRVRMATLAGGSAALALVGWCGAYVSRSLGPEPAAPAAPAIVLAPVGPPVAHRLRSPPQPSAPASPPPARRSSPPTRPPSPVRPAPGLVRGGFRPCRSRCRCRCAAPAWRSSIPAAPRGQQRPPALPPSPTWRWPVRPTGRRLRRGHCRTWARGRRRSSLVIGSPATLAPTARRPGRLRPTTGPPPTDRDRVDIGVATVATSITAELRGAALPTRARLQLDRLRSALTGARTRILGWYVILLAVAIGLSLVAERQVLLHRLSNRVDTQLTVDADALSHQAAGSRSSVTALFDNYLRTHVAAPDEEFLTIVGARPYEASFGGRYRLEQLGGFVSRVAGVADPVRGDLDTPAGPVRYLAVPVVQPG